MSLIFFPVLATLGVAVAPVLVRIFDRKAGWPLAALFLVLAALLIRQSSEIFHGEALTWRMQWVPDVLGTSVDLSLRADALAVFFALLALVIGAVVFIYSAAYLPRFNGNTSFYTLMTAFTAAILLLVLADDVVVLFIAWELVSLASFMLIARSGGKGGEHGSQRTLLLTFVGGLTLLVALVIAAVYAGSTNVTEILASNFWSENPTLTSVLAVLVAISAFTKSAQLPFHFWLPEAMAAATPVSAFLHAAAVVKAGIYLLLRFSAVFHDVKIWNLLLIIVGMATALVASLYAIQKTDLKKLTAYSTVSHLGWIVATIGVGTPFALAAALVHTLAHALFKSSLFMLIGVVDHQTGTRNLTRLGSSWRQLPFTFTSVVIAAGSMAAIPPLLGFISKEGMLTAFQEAPLSGLGIGLLLFCAGIGAFFTLTYSTRIIADGFIDGPRDMSNVKEAPLSLWLPAALPGLLSVPLVFVVSQLDRPISAAVTSTTADPHLHLGLWHGFNTPLIISVAVLVAGAIGAVFRKQIWDRIDAIQFSPYSGNDLLRIFNQTLSKIGRVPARMADSLSPARHLAFMFGFVVFYGLVVLIDGLRYGGIDGVPLAPRVPGADRVTDLLPLVIVILGVWSLLRARTRLTAVIVIGAIGVGVTLQILTLGAPDVALTQFLVEALVVVIMMLVVRQQPEKFHPTKKRRKVAGAVLASGIGVVVFLTCYTLLGRHDRSELAMWYLEKAPEITSGDNVVNTILVEFRAFDTMGELTVLGMAAVVIAAVVTSMPRYPFHKGTHPDPIGQSTVNSIPLRTLLKVLIPILLVLSVMIFWRGHNSPGGGFIAALVAGCAMMLSYLSFPRDRRIFPVNTPIYLTGAGVLIAVGAGFLGLLRGSFLYAIHGHGLGQHWTTSMIFDVGVYLAVLGMLSMAINALGGYLRPGMEYQDLNFNRQDSPLESLAEVDTIMTAQTAEKAQGVAATHGVEGANQNAGRAAQTARSAEENAKEEER